MLQVVIDRLRWRVSPKLFLSQAIEFLKFVTRMYRLWALEKQLLSQGEHLWQEPLHPLIGDNSPISHIREAGWGHGL